MSLTSSSKWCREFLPWDSHFRLHTGTPILLVKDEAVCSLKGIPAEQCLKWIEISASTALIHMLACVSAGM